MKNLIFVLLLAPLLGASNANLEEITRAISAGDANALSRFFDQTVEISVLDKEDVYNKAQAVQVLNNFFSQHKPKSFSQVHQGTSKGNDSQYCIGNLVTGDHTYRVYIYMKVAGNKVLIQELRFDQE